MQDWVKKDCQIKLKEIKSRDKNYESKSERKTNNKEMKLWNKKRVLNDQSLYKNFH